MSFNTLGPNRSALIRRQGRRPNTMPRLRATAILERARPRSRSRSNFSSAAMAMRALRAAQIELQSSLDDKRYIPRLQQLQVLLSVLAAANISSCIPVASPWPRDEENTMTRSTHRKSEYLTENHR